MGDISQGLTGRNAAIFICGRLISYSQVVGDDARIVKTLGQPSKTNLEDMP
jgi:hypothetical protein